MRIARVCGLVVGVAVLAGCGAYRPVELPPGGVEAAVREQAAVQPGDRVRVTLTDGKIEKFRVVEVRRDALVGEAVVVPLDAIESLESREFSKGRTAALAGGVSAGTILLVLAVLSAVTFMP